MVSLAAGLNKPMESQVFVLLMLQRDLDTARIYVARVMKQ